MRFDLVAPLVRPSPMFDKAGLLPQRSDGVCDLRRRYLRGLPPTGDAKSFVLLARKWEARDSGAQQQLMDLQEVSQEHSAQC